MRLAEESSMAGNASEALEVDHLLGDSITWARGQTSHCSVGWPACRHVTDAEVLREGLHA
jgi:hypothetical protein